MPTQPLENEAFAAICGWFDNARGYRIDNVMKTTTSVPLLLEVAQELATALDAEDRGSRIVEAIRRVLPADGVSLLRLHGNSELVPVAQHGLAPEVLGRRFPLAEHPRLAQICASASPVQFPPDSELPDPFDGMLADFPIEGHTVHACMGCSLRVRGRLYGALTLDAEAAEAFDGVKPELLEALAALAAAALHNADLLHELERDARLQGALAEDLARDADTIRGSYLIGRSTQIEQVRTEVEMIGPSDLPVLITGETGSGKEVIARMLHAASRRADRPLIYLNCAALPASVAESELFGHESGAFTDAKQTRLGKFQVADGSCLFLDEIGELPLEIQAKLLRAVQFGEIQRVGSDRPTHVDVRVIAATNRDLHREAGEGRFRSDLLHRLDVCRLHAPPLREHPEDLPLLAGHACDELRRQLGAGPIRLSEDALDALASYPWPGNVRELQNVLSRATLNAAATVHRGESVILKPEHLGSDFSKSIRDEVPDLDTACGASQAVSAQALPSGPLRPAVDAFQREMIASALARHDGVWARAAEELGLHRSNLHHLAKRLGLRTTRDPGEAGLSIR